MKKIKNHSLDHPEPISSIILACFLPMFRLGILKNVIDCDQAEFFCSGSCYIFLQSTFSSNKTLLTVFTISKSHVSDVRDIQSSSTAGCKRRILI